MYLLCCAVIFALFAVPVKHRFEWSCLAILSVFLWCNKSIFDISGAILYYNRAVFTFIIGLLLVRRFSMVGIYQAFILLLMLISYGLLAHHVSIGHAGWYYNNYENVIHGLVICQFIGIFPIVWDRDNDSATDFDFISKYLQRFKRT